MPLQSQPRPTPPGAPDVSQSPTGQIVDGDATESPATDSSDTRSREDRVREAAHRRFVERGQEHGLHEEDWSEAEREVDRSSGSSAE